MATPLEPSLQDVGWLGPDQPLPYRASAKPEHGGGNIERDGRFGHDCFESYLTAERPLVRQRGATPICFQAASTTANFSESTP
jgi:hypothetical protein